MNIYQKLIDRRVAKGYDRFSTEELMITLQVTSKDIITAWLRHDFITEAEAAEMEEVGF